MPSSSTLRLLQHWRGAELRYLRGGHVTGLVAGRSLIARAILDAFSRIEDLQLPDEPPEGAVPG